MKRILLISTQKNAPAYSNRKKVLGALVEALEDTNISVDSALFEDLDFVIKSGVPSIWNRTAGCDVSDYDLVYVKNWKAHHETASALAAYLDSKGVRYVCSELRDFRVTGKIAEGYLLALAGIRYPDTFFTVLSRDLPELVRRYEDDLSYPIILKGVDASAGEDNYLVHNEAQLIEHIRRDGTIYMVQNFIRNDGDHRVIVLGYEPALSFKRQRQDESSHLNNTSQGASARLTDIRDYSEAVLRDVVMAARIVKREIAGVDVLYDSETGEHYILEVNASPQLVTGTFLPEKRRVLRAYFQSLLDA